MLRILFRKHLQALLNQAYEVGVNTGRELERRLAQAEKSNRGFIVGSKMNREIEEILKEKGG